MPAELRAQIEGIVTWAKSNGRDAFWQGIYFWSLKTPVVISAGAYGALSYFDQKAWAVAVGGIAGVCALIDGLLRPGQLYRFFSVAEYGLMSLSNRAWADWSAGKLRGEDRNTLAARIIDYTEDEKLKISATLSDAASTLGGSAPISTAGAPSEKVKGAST